MKVCEVWPRVAALWGNICGFFGIMTGDGQGENEQEQPGQEQPVPDEEEQQGNAEGEERQGEPEEEGSQSEDEEEEEAIVQPDADIGNWLIDQLHRRREAVSAAIAEIGEMVSLLLLCSE